MERRSLSIALIAGWVLTLSGCDTGTTPSPFDPANASIVEVEQVQLTLRGIWSSLEYRVDTGEIKRSAAEAEFVKRATEFAVPLDADDVAPGEAWRVGDVQRAAKRWSEALRAYQRATEHPADDDRRTVDRLRLAEALAWTKKPQEALKMARTAFSAQPSNKGSILLAVIYEVAPPLMTQKVDGELAKLILDAIRQHLQADIPITSPEGKAFYLARPSHIRYAFDQALRLLERSGKKAEARRVLRQRTMVLMQLNPRR